MRVLYAIRWLIECGVGLLDPLPPLVSLALVAVVTGVLAVAIATRVSPRRRLARSRDQMAAAIFEMRLFLDAPRRVLAAQGRLLAWTTSYLACMVPAAVVLAIPFGTLFLQLELRHGRAPIAAPATVVLRIALASGVDTGSVGVTTAHGVAVTAPYVIAADEPAVYARLRIDEPGTHHVSIHAASEVVDKEIVAAPGVRVTPERRAGLAQLWMSGAEPPLAGDAIERISIPHRARGRLRVGFAHPWLGISMPWWLYWIGLSTIAGLVFARRQRM